MIGPAGIAVSPPLPSPGFAGRISERLRLWRRRRRWIVEMASAAALGRLDDTLSDVGLTRGELDALIEGPVDAGKEFETLAQMARIDLHHLEPTVLREATWVCSRCQSRAPCQRWLRTGVWRDGADMRCPNAALLRR